MSIEAQITIRAVFPNDDTAKIATSLLKKSLKKNKHELASSLSEINNIENQCNYKDDTINVEDISRKKNVLSIYSYTYTSEEPTWFAKSLCQLGANKLLIQGQWDGHRRNFYFLDGEKVPKKKYDGDKPKKPLSAKDIEINKHLFLPADRVSVNVTLVNHWSVGDIYESELLEFITDNGETFFHKATGKLKELSYEGAEKQCQFSATFERGKHNGEYVSLAKRPTKIVFSRTDQISNSSIQGQTNNSFNTIIKCPFCGSSLRTEKAKQCPQCFKNWKEQS